MRQILKCANRHGCLAYLPDLSAPFRASGERLRGRLRPVIEENEDGEEPSGRSESASAEMVKPKPTDLLFDRSHRELLKTVLEEEKLKFDREGNRRTAYSLRHTYICLRLMEDADIYQIAQKLPDFGRDD